jgi:hypothetical protein
MRTLEERLRACVHPRQDDWHKYMGPLKFAYNNSVQASTGQTPFFLTLGRHPATPFDRALPCQSQVPAAKEFLETLADASRRQRTTYAWRSSARPSMLTVRAANAPSYWEIRSCCRQRTYGCLLDIGRACVWHNSSTTSRAVMPASK